MKHPVEIFVLLLSVAHAMSSLPMQPPQFQDAAITALVILATGPYRTDSLSSA